MDNATIVKLLEMQREDLKNLKIDLTNTIETNGLAVRGLMRSEVDRIDAMDQRRNGIIADHSRKISQMEEVSLNIRHYQKGCKANKFVDKFSKPRFWVIASTLVVIVYFLLATLYHEVGIGAVINKLVSLL